MNEPLCIDLYAGLGGWAEGFLAEGYRVKGYDIEAHDYGTGGYPGELILADVLKLHGSQFKDAAVIVGSSPCTEYSYMAMPWERAKQIARALRGKDEFPAGYQGSRTIEQLNALFDAQFRIQREACEAAGRYIPMIVENVRGAQPWVGRAKANFGSYYLWGDVGMVGKRVVAGVPRYGVSVQPMKAMKIDGYSDPRRNGGQGAHLTCQRENDARLHPDLCDKCGYAVQIGHVCSTRAVWVALLPDHGSGSLFKIADSKERGARAEGEKVGGLTWSDYGKPGYVAKAFNVTAAQRYREGVKQKGSGAAWFDSGLCTKSSKSDSRKAASAQIAKIPFPLASYIACSFLHSQWPGMLGARRSNGDSRNSAMPLYAATRLLAAKTRQLPRASPQHVWKEP